MSEQKRFHSGFTRVRVTEDGGQKIKKLQEEFDLFWKKMNKYADKGTEKYYALKAMQESCMWLSRACALKHEAVPEIIIDDPLAKIPLNHTTKMGQTIETITSTGFKLTEKMASLAGLKDGQVIKNNPRIVVKKKRT